MRGWRLLLCATLLGCSVADPDLLKRSPASGGESGSGGTPDGSGGTASGGSQGSGGTSTGGTTTGGTTTGGTTAGGTMSECESVGCQWSATDDQGCEQALLPTEDDRPPMATLDGEILPDGPTVYLALTRVWLGETSIDPTVTPMPSDSDGGVPDTADGGLAGFEDTDENAPWKTFGFDLDGVCTASGTCDPSKTNLGSCARTGIAVPLDGDYCRDNAYARLQPVAAAVPELGDVLGATETAINCSLYRGSYNQLIKLTGYNGSVNDDRVRVDVYASPGLASPLDLQCPQDNFRESGLPEWISASPWLIDESSLTAPMSSDGGLADAIYSSPDAFVADGYLVAPLPDGYDFRLPGDNADFPGWVNRFRRAFLIGKLEQQPDSTWLVTEGMIAGVQHRDDLILSYRNVGLCPGGPYDTIYSAISAYLLDGSDSLSDLSVNPDMECDSISTGIRFTAKSATPGDIVSTRAVVDCCLPENAQAPGCPIRCGDGRLTGDEACDVGIPAGQPGACPTTCAQDTDPCTSSAVEGEGCQQRCVETTITAPIDGDQCCPTGENSENDSDCPVNCGNGVVEQGETCDPQSTCPDPSLCVSNDACTVATSSGSDQACDVACTLSDVTACVDDDGCCPGGGTGTCNYVNDNDCPPANVVCGDGMVGQGETCDSAIPQGQPGACVTSCPDSDADPCKVDRLIGGASTCNARCVVENVSTCGGAEGCCLPQCNANNDVDCSPTCGNRVIEPGEDCDDGNDQNLDGCVDCRTETAFQQCMTIAPQTEAPVRCQECVCSRCTDVSLQCANTGSPVEDPQCIEVVKCGLEERCTDQYCYCGLNPVCFPPIGPCVSEIHAAAGTTDPGVVLSRQDNLSYPVGRAKAVGNCMLQRCKTECGF